MPGKPPGYLVLGILNLLDDGNEMSRAELCAAMRVDRMKCSATVSRMARPTKTGPKRIYVIRYAYHDDTNGRYYPRALYARGNLPDAKRPRPLSQAECSRRWRARARHRVSNVFDWAQPRRVRDVIQRKMREAA